MSKWLTATLCWILMGGVFVAGMGVLAIWMVIAGSRSAEIIWTIGAVCVVLAITATLMAIETVRSKRDGSAAAAPRL